MKVREFTVPGVPVAKARPRSVQVGGRIRTYTPQKTARYEDTVRLCAMAAGIEPIDGPVALDVRLYWPTRGAARKREPRPECWKVTRPDADNCAKAIFDGLAGVAYADDAQVCSVLLQKLHAAQGDAPRAVVRVVAL